MRVHKGADLDCLLKDTGVITGYEYQELKKQQTESLKERASSLDVDPSSLSPQTLCELAVQNRWVDPEMIKCLHLLQHADRLEAMTHYGLMGLEKPFQLYFLIKHMKLCDGLTKSYFDQKPVHCSAIEAMDHIYHLLLCAIKQAYPKILGDPHLLDQNKAKMNLFQDEIILYAEQAAHMLFLWEKHSLRERLVQLQACYEEHGVDEKKWGTERLLFILQDELQQKSHLKKEQVQLLNLGLRVMQAYVIRGAWHALQCASPSMTAHAYRAGRMWLKNIVARSLNPSLSAMIQNEINHLQLDVQQPFKKINWYRKTWKMVRFEELPSSKEKQKEKERDLKTRLYFNKIEKNNAPNENSDLGLALHAIMVKEVMPQGLLDRVREQEQSVGESLLQERGEGGRVSALLYVGPEASQSMEDSKEVSKQPSESEEKKEEIGLPTSSRVEQAVAQTWDLTRDWTVKPLKKMKDWVSTPLV